MHEKRGPLTADCMISLPCILPRRGAAAIDPASGSARLEAGRCTAWWAPIPEPAACSCHRCTAWWAPIPEPAACSCHLGMGKQECRQPLLPLEIQLVSHPKPPFPPAFASSRAPMGPIRQSPAVGQPQKCDRSHRLSARDAASPNQQCSGVSFMCRGWHFAHHEACSLGTVIDKSSADIAHEGLPLQAGLQPSP
jgi:hypothetical protein